MCRVAAQCGVVSAATGHAQAPEWPAPPGGSAWACLPPGSWPNPQPAGHRVSHPDNLLPGDPLLSLGASLHPPKPNGLPTHEAHSSPQAPVLTEKLGRQQIQKHPESIWWEPQREGTPQPCPLPVPPACRPVLPSQGPVLCWAGGRAPPTQGSSPLQLLSDESVPWAPPSTPSWEPRRPDGPSHPSAWRTQRPPSKSSEPGGDRRAPSYPVTPTTRWPGEAEAPQHAERTWLEPESMVGRGSCAAPGLQVGRSRSEQMGRKDGAGTGWGLGEGPGGKAAQPTARGRPRGILHHGPWDMRSEKRL